MNMSVELISAIFTGMVGLLTAAAGLNFTRNKKLDKAHRDLVTEFNAVKREMRIVRKLNVLQARHIAAVEKANARGLQHPEVPEEIALLEAQLEALEEAALMSEGVDLAKVA